MTPTSTATPVSSGLSFYRAININGTAQIIDGNPWEGSPAPNYSQIGTNFCSPWTTLNPSTDASRATMIRCYVQHWAHNLILSSVPVGTYDVYVYVWLDWADPNPSTWRIRLEGVTVASNMRLNGAGDWRRLGPFRATINDGTINVGSGGGILNVSGIEVYRVGSDAFFSAQSQPAASIQIVPPTLEATATPTAAGDAPVLVTPPVPSGEAGEGSLGEAPAG